MGVEAVKSGAIPGRNRVISQWQLLALLALAVRDGLATINVYVSRGLVMLERIVHWLVFAAIVSFLLTAAYQLITSGVISDICCTIE